MISRKSNEELFIEFITLNDSVIYNRSNTVVPLADYMIGDFIIVRVYDKLSIIFLHSGTRYIIPIEYYNIFSEFSFYNFSQLGKYEERKIDRFIYEMSRLCNMILRKFKDVSQEDIEGIVRAISECSTNDIRDLIYNRFKITLWRIDYESLNYDKLY